MSGTDAFSLDGFLPYLLNQAAESAGRSFAKVYKDRYGIGRTEWRVIAHLGAEAPLTGGTIAQRAMMHKAKISRAVFELEQRGWVSRKADKTDRRVEHLSLTREGKRIYRELSKDAAAHHAQLRQRLGVKKTQALIDALKVLRD